MGQARNKVTRHDNSDLEGELDLIYSRARRNVVRKMRRHGEEAAAAQLPERCPYTLDQILGDWEPDGNQDTP